MHDLLDQEGKRLIDSLAIDLRILQAATKDFSLDRELGRGFGTVYKVCRFNVASSFDQWIHFFYRVVKCMSPYCTGNSP